LTPENIKKLEAAVHNAAFQTLKQKHYVSPVDILQGLGWLTPRHLEDWRKTKVPYLEKVANSNLKRISRAMKIFRSWARENGLKESQAAYVAHTRGYKKRLQFSKSGDYTIERLYKTHYVSPKIADSKSKKSKDRQSLPKKPEVFSTLKPSTNTECSAGLHFGSFI